MAAYDGTPERLDNDFELGDRNGKAIRVVKRLRLTLDTQGGATNKITAQSLGFRAGYLKKATFLHFEDDTGPQDRALFVWTDGDNLYVGDPQDSTDGSRGEPADVSGDLDVEVEGLI